MSTRIAALVVVGLFVTASRAAAQFGLPSTTHHYAVLPRLSVLHETGGFAGVDLRYRVFGDFNFKVEQSPLAVFPPVYYAKFIDPEIKGFHVLFDRVVDVDQVFNLAALTGGQNLQGPRRPNLFQFRGKTGDGSTVELNALLRGPWLYLRGGTTSPEGSADFFEYDLRAVARRTPIADLDDNGVVDADDLRTLRTNPGLDGGAILEWQRQFGETPPSIESLDAELTAALTGAIGAVPEPGSLGLLTAAGGALIAARRRSSLRRDC